ncbi:unnamed protein product [Meloidogyne enterolobii]|uniref:Uncharacterized protein n=2 Tax=Meloidogyne enterolobii TaxID=390850 RepID=A0ACB0ZF09_MELEN
MLGQLMLEGSSLTTLLLVEWLLLLLPFALSFGVCIVTCGGQKKQPPPGKQQKPPTLQSPSNPPKPKENPKAATTSTKISAPKPQQLGGGPGSTIQVPFSKEKMLWSAAMTDKGDGKKK